MSEQDFLQRYSHVCTDRGVFLLTSRAELPAPDFSDMGLEFDESSYLACLTQDSVAHLAADPLADTTISRQQGGSPGFGYGYVRSSSPSVIHVVDTCVPGISWVNTIAPHVQTNHEDWSADQRDAGLDVHLAVQQLHTTEDQRGRLIAGPSLAGLETTEIQPANAFIYCLYVFYPRWWTDYLGDSIVPPIRAFVNNLGALYQTRTSTRFTKVCVVSGSDYATGRVIQDSETCIQGRLEHLFPGFVHAGNDQLEGAIGCPLSTITVREEYTDTIDYFHTFQDQPTPGPDDPSALYQIRNPLRHSHGVGTIDDLLIPARRTNTGIR